MALGSSVTVKLVQQAIEYRWGDAERSNRNVYVAFDMATYLEQEIVRKGTMRGRVNRQIEAMQGHLDDAV